MKTHNYYNPVLEMEYPKKLDCCLQTLGLYNADGKCLEEITITGRQAKDKKYFAYKFISEDNSEYENKVKEFINASDEHKILLDNRNSEYLLDLSLECGCDVDVIKKVINIISITEEYIIEKYQTDSDDSSDKEFDFKMYNDCIKSVVELIK